MFHQFLDCVWQLTCQFPSHFEFNESLLIFLFDEVGIVSLFGTLKVIFDVFCFGSFFLYL